MYTDEYCKHTHTCTDTNTSNTSNSTQRTQRYCISLQYIVPHTHTLQDCVSDSGVKPPRPDYTPSPNGNVNNTDMSAVNQRVQTVSTQWQSRLQDMLTPTSSRAYTMACAIVSLLLLTVFLIFYFLGRVSISLDFTVFCLDVLSGAFMSQLRASSWRHTPHVHPCNTVFVRVRLHLCFVSVLFPVQQGGALQRLTEAVRQKEAAATQLSQLIQELQALRHNLTVTRGGGT